MTYGIVGYSGHNLTLSQIFATINVGGGGFMRMLDLNPDGTKLCASDVTGCWLWNSGASQWDSLLTGARGFTEATPGLYAAYDMASAPSNSSVIYIYLNDGNLYRSLNKGVSFVQLTGFATAPCGTNNGGTRFNGRRIAIDPINADVVYIGTPANGVFVTSNGSQGSASTPIFSSVAGVTAASNPDGYNIAFDPNGGTTTGKTNVVAIFSNGTGMYTTAAPLGAVTLQTTGSSVPTACSRLVCSQHIGTGSSIFYVSDDTTTVHKFAAGSWSALSPSITAHSITVDPADNTHLVAGDGGGKLSVSANSGGAWTVLTWPNAISSATIPWMAVTQEAFMTNGDIVFDPSLTNSLMFAEGIGIFTTTPPSSGNFTWTAQSAGIENLQTNQICASPNVTGTPTTACWDRYTFYIANPTNYPATQGPNNLYSIQPCWDLDWASSDQTTIISMAPNNVLFMDASASSSDGGQTWNFFAPATGGARTVTTSGASIAGSSTLTIASQPFTLHLQMLVTNATAPASIPSGAYITGINGSTITLSKQIQSPGVGSGDTINIQFAANPTVRYLQTSAATVSGAVLTFASAVPADIKVGMHVNGWDNNAALNIGGSTMAVLSISGSTVTLNHNVVSTVASGDIIVFSWGPGGCVAALSPSNFLMSAVNDAGFPYVTADSGATWTAIDIAGVPRPVAATFNGTTTIACDTSNLVVGGKLSSALGFIPGNTTVVSITDATHFVASAVISTGTDVLMPETGWGHANYLNHKILAADRVTANKCYMYNYVTGKIYVSTLSGANGTWSVANSVNTPVGNTNLNATFGMNGGQNMAMKSVPGQAGNLFASGANIVFDTDSFIRSTDSGATWSAVANVSKVNCFGFGKANPSGGTYPAVFIIGTYNGVKGVFRSDDNCASFVTVLARNSYNILDGLDQTVVIEGDKNTFGKFYVAFGGSGCAYSFLG